MTEREKEELREKAKMFRQCADIMEELAGTEDEKRIEELAVKLAVKLVKIGM